MTHEALKKLAERVLDPYGLTDFQPATEALAAGYLALSAKLSALEAENEAARIRAYRKAAPVPPVQSPDSQA